MIGCLRRFGPFLGVQIFLFSEKLIYLGMKIFFWGGGGGGAGSSQNWTSFRGHFYVF